MKILIKKYLMSEKYDNVPSSWKSSEEDAENKLGEEDEVNGGRGVLL